MSEMIDWKIVIDLAQWITTLGIAFFVWISGKQRATRSQINEVKDAADARLDRHEQRLTKMEEHIRHMPSASDFKELSDRLHQFHGDLREVSTEVKNFRELTGMVRRQIELMDEYLRRQSS
jgi:archaellum component FlaC